jgi:hypothetical protein
MDRWHIHTRTSKNKPSAEQQRQQHKAALQQACKAGKHATTPTFRPSETICQGCGAVLYCPTCFKQHHLSPAKNGRALACSLHQQVEVQA